MGRRQGHLPGEGDVGVGVGAPMLAWEWSQQRSWPGPSSTGGVGKLPLHRHLLGQSPPVLLLSLALSPARALTCSQPLAMLTHTTQPSTGNLPLQDRPFLILLPTFPHSRPQQGLVPSWCTIKFCWVEKLVSE